MDSVFCKKTTDNHKKQFEHVAHMVVEELKKKDGPTLTLLEAMSMTPVMTDGYTVFAITKDDVTFLAWKRRDGSILTKVICW